MGQMGQVSRKSDKPGRASVAARRIEQSDRWTVRGVPARLQKAAAEAAWAADLTVGAWLSRLVEGAVDQVLPPAEPSTIERFAAIEQRLDRLERHVGERAPAGIEPSRTLVP